MKPALPLALAAALAAGGAHAATAVESRFDSDAEGWTLTDAKTGVGSAAPAWLPEGRLHANDVFDWNAFAAPAAYLGDLGGHYGGTLWFELQAGRQDAGAANYFTAALRSGGDLLVWFGGAPASTELTSFSVRLDTTGGWELNPATLGQPGTGSALDEAGMRQFMSQVDGLYIDADYRFGSDDVSLDNVLLLPVPEPGSLALWLAGGGMLGWLARHRSGAR